MEKETLEEAAANLADPNLCKTDNWIAGAQWQAKRMYSEEDMRKVLLAIELVNPVHLTILHSGHGEFPDGYKLTQKGVDYIIEQFKKK